MKVPSTIEQDRINHINCLMDTLHENTNLIYENLIDRSFTELSGVIDNQLTLLQDLKTSIENEL